MADLQSIPIKAAEFDIFAAPLLSWSDSPCFCRQPPPVVGQFFFHRRLQTNSLFFLAPNFPPRSNPNSNVSGNDKLLKHISYVALFCVGAVCVFSATAYLFFRCVGLEWDGVLCARYALVLFYSLFLIFFFSCRTARVDFCFDFIPSTMNWPITVGWTELRRRCTGIRMLPGRFPRSTIWTTDRRCTPASTTAPTLLIRTSCPRAWALLSTTF